MSPAFAWMIAGSPTDLMYEYPVSLVMPFANVVTCALLSAGAVLFYRKATWLGSLQWLVVGALLAVTVVWGFSLGPMFLPTLIVATIAAVLSDGITSRTAMGRAAAFVAGAAIQLLIMWAFGYLHVANVDLRG
jgi:hypothetical protein